jgi:hypothetical protein
MSLTNAAYNAAYAWVSVANPNLRTVEQRG